MCDNSSKKHSGLLTAYFFQLCTGNDNPYRMDYQGCEHPFTILYRPLPEGIGGYFPDDVARSVNVGIDVPPVRCLVQPALDTLAAKGVLLIAALANGQRVQVKQTGFT